jgi:hypothetical protein
MSNITINNKKLSPYNLFQIEPQETEHVKIYKFLEWIQQWFLDNQDITYSSRRTMWGRLLETNKRGEKGARQLVKHVCDLAKDEYEFNDVIFSDPNDEFQVIHNIFKGNIFLKDFRIYQFHYFPVIQSKMDKMKKIINLQDHEYDWKVDVVSGAEYSSFDRKYKIDTENYYELVPYDSFLQNYIEGQEQTNNFETDNVNTIINVMDEIDLSTTELILLSKYIINRIEA